MAQRHYSAFENVFRGGGPWINSSMWDETAPKAYLNYLLFDENFVLVDAGFDQISTDCQQESDMNPVALHDYLSLHVKVEQKGYLYVCLSNEQPTLTNVYFDDMKIVQYSAVEQVNDYYPFGLTFNSYQRENSLDQNYKFNGKEEQTELGLGWLDFGRRMHQPEIGRFVTQDRFAEKYYALNPYQYGANNPIIFNDMNGDSLWINFGNNRVLYDNGQLQNADGSRYEGEGVKVTKKGNIRITNSFLRSTVGALKTIGYGEAGANLVGELQSSDNNFTIKQGNYRFNPDNKNNASFHQVMDEGKLLDPSKGITQIGSGGTIYFNPEVSPTINGTTFSPAIGLAHEMFHGSDSNSGELDSRNIPFNGVCCEQRQEIRATYFQNALSQQLGGGYPLRKYYGGTKYPPMPPALLNGSTPLNTYPPSFYLKIKN